MISSAANEAKKEALKVTMDVRKMSITDISNDQINVVGTVVVSNPLPAPLNASRFDYTVFAGGSKVAGGSYTEEIHLPAAGSQTLQLPMTVSAEAMDRLNNSMQAKGQEQVRYTFRNVLHTNIPVAGERVIRFDIEKILPVVWTPRLEPGKVSVTKLGLKNSGAQMIARITNPNAFDIRMADIRYSVSIDGQETVHGTMQEVVRLPANSTTPVAMQMDLKTGKALKMGWKMLFDKKETRYKMLMNCRILSQSRILSHFNMQFTDEGNLQDLKQSLKKADE